MLNSRKSCKLRKMILLVESQTRRYNGSVLKRQLCLIALRYFLLADTCMKYAINHETVRSTKEY